MEGVPTLAAARLQKWSLILAAYQYDITYKPSLQHSNADALSRLPLTVESKESKLCFRVSFLDSVPISAQEIAKQTKLDTVLQKVKHFTLNGWPKHVTEAELKPYILRHTELTVESECVLWGFRVVVPEVLRSKMLTELHHNHQGMVKMKALAQSHFWWPNLDADIEILVNSCQTCQADRNQPATAPVHHWSWPNRPWQRIHVDFAQKGKYNFLVVTEIGQKLH